MSAFIQIQQASLYRDQPNTVGTPGETESDDEIALREAQEKGYLTEDETIYFKATGVLTG